VADVPDESARNEIYVQEFPDGVNEWAVSTKGGMAPRWVLREVADSAGQIRGMGSRS